MPTRTLLFVSMIMPRDVANFKLNARKESKKVVLSSEAREALRFFLFRWLSWLSDVFAINHVVRKIFDRCHNCDHREYLANDYLVYNHFKAKFEEKVNRFGLPR